MKTVFDNCGYIAEYAIKANILEKSQDGRYLLFQYDNEIIGIHILAKAICTIEGNFTYNKLSNTYGYSPQLPKEIKKMFSRHIISKSTDSIKSISLLEKMSQWFKKLSGEQI